LYENKDKDTILEEMRERVSGDISTGEGTLVNFALAPAAAELEEIYYEMGVADENGSALTCDREHLILKGQEDNIPIKTATAAVWLATFNEDFDIGERFECGDLTFISTQKVSDGKYYLECETLGSAGNVKPDEELLSIDFISETLEGELTELIQAAADDEDTEVYRERYLAEKKIENNGTGNRAWYKNEITGIIGVAAVKLARVTKTRKRIDAYILSSSWGVPSDEVVSVVQNTIDPLSSQGDGEGQAPFWHVVDVHPVAAKSITIGAKITLQSGVAYEDIKEDIEAAVDALFIELNKTWEDEEYLTVRALRVAEAIGSVSGVVDVQDLTLNGEENNLTLGAYEIPVRGDIHVV
jgi:uncharacterized phage protein gp47/JayE